MAKPRIAISAIHQLLIRAYQELDVPFINVPAASVEQRLEFVSPKFGWDGVKVMTRLAVGGSEALLVARLIGPDTDPEVVQGLVDATNAGRIIMHGVKRVSSVPGIVKKGVEPLAPEGGPGSFWATGWSIFCGDRPSPVDAGWAYDTPFFHYGIAHNPTGPNKMVLAVTDAERLAALGINTDGMKSNDQYVVHQTVPATSLTLLVVDAVPGERLTKTALEFMATCLGSGLLHQSGVLTNT